VRLIGFAAALLTLLQVVQGSKEAQFHYVIPISFPDFGMFSTWFKALVLFLGVFILMTFGVRAMFRFAWYGLLSSRLIDLPPFTCVEGESYMTTVESAIVKRVLKKKPKLYWVFPVKWIAELTKESSKIVWFLYLLIALVLTIALLLLLW